MEEWEGWRSRAAHEVEAEAGVLSRAAVRTGEGYCCCGGVAVVAVVAVVVVG